MDSGGVRAAQAKITLEKGHKILERSEEKAERRKRKRKKLRGAERKYL